MASNEMVTRSHNLMRDLRAFAEFLRGEIHGILLCMAYQTTSTVDPGSWTFCVCADELDDKSERAAIALVWNWMETRLSRESLSMIERVVVLRAFEPDAAAILSAAMSVEDGHRLTGYPILGREIARAEIFIVGGSAQRLPQRQSVRA